jgi:hypothetical protein
MNTEKFIIALEPHSSLLQEICTGCGKTDSMFEVEHVDCQTLCQSCYRSYLPALKIEEQTTQPWTIDEKLSEANWQAQLLTRRTTYRESLATL